MRILIVSAHPDDIEFACAGSVAIWIQEGHEVSYVIVTDGSTGTQDRDLVGPKLAEIRREESLKAAAAVGVTDVRFLGYPDGSVEPTLALRRDTAREFRRYRPDRYLVMDPQPLPGGWFINHPDHRAIGQASLDAVICAGTTPGHFPELIDEGFEPWQGVQETWVMGPAGGETAVDISSTIDRKIEALQAHASQTSGWADIGQAVRTWTRSIGEPHGFAHAEAFHLIGRTPGSG